MPKMVSLAFPDKFDGSVDKCRDFIRQVEMYFDQQKGKFASYNQKCAFLMTLIMGRVITRLLMFESQIHLFVPLMNTLNNSYRVDGMMSN